MKPINQENPQYIKKHEIESATFSEKISWEIAQEKKRENDLKQKHIEDTVSYYKKKLFFWVIFAISGPILTLLGTLTWRDIEYRITGKGGTIQDKLSCGVESLIRLQNIEKLTIENHKQLKFDHNMAWTMKNYLTDVHRKQFPEKHPNSFGYYKGKK